MRWVYLAVIAVLALAILIFALQNFQSITVSFLRLQLSAPLAVLIVLIYLLGMATGGSAWALVGWGWDGSKQGWRSALLPSSRISPPTLPSPPAHIRPAPGESPP